MPRVGSQAPMPCPVCGENDAKVAFTTEEITYYRCLSCHHGWSQPERRQRQMTRHPERRRPEGKSDK